MPGSNKILSEISKWSSTSKSVASKKSAAGWMVNCTNVNIEGYMKFKDNIKQIIFQYFVHYRCEQEYYCARILN